MICKTAAELLSRAADAPLTAGERVTLAIHLMVCGACRRFKRQLARLEEYAATLADADAGAEGVELTPEARGRIAAAIERG